MPGKQDKRIVKVVLDRFGQTFSSELGAYVEKNQPSGLFQLLCFSVMASTRISHNAAMQAARALKKAGWTTAKNMARTTWEQRVKVLNENGYARYDESTSRYLGHNVELLQDQYNGDLRRLREAADRDPDAERERLKQFKGIGDVGVDIFFREVQAAWDELLPFGDSVALKAAGKLGLPDDAAALLKLTTRKEFPRLVAGLVRVQLDNQYTQVRQQAEQD